MRVIVTQPPDGYQRKNNHAWCPYCGKETIFGLDKKLDSTRCIACGISSRDFYVRILNGLGKDRELERFERDVKKLDARYKKGGGADG
jgi:transcription elongation factor Elf1